MTRSRSHKCFLSNGEDHCSRPDCKRLLSRSTTSTIVLQVKIRGETLQLRNAWRRVTQRLPGDRANAASASNSESASPSRSGDADVATQPDAAVSEPRKQDRGRLEPQVDSAPQSRSQSSQATATVSITAGHSADHGVGGAVSAAAACEVEQPPSCVHKEQQPDTDVAEPELDTPQPAHKRARSAATTSQDPSPAAADGLEAGPDTAVEDPAAVADGAAASELTLMPPCVSPTSAEAPAVVVMVTTNSSPPTSQQGSLVVVTSGGRPHRAASPVCGAVCDDNQSAEPSQAEVTCVTPTKVVTVRAAPVVVTPSTVEVSIVKPTKARLQRAGGRRRGTARQPSAEPKQPTTPAAGAAQKAKRKRQR